MLARLLQIFFFTLPFQFALNPVNGVDLHLSRVFVAVIFFVWLSQSLDRRALWLPKSIPVILALSFLFVAGVSFLWAEAPMWSVRKMLFLLSYAPLLFVLSDLFQREGSKIAMRILRAFVFGSAFAAMVGIFQFAIQFFIGVERTFSFWIGYVLPIFLGNEFSSEVAAFPSLLANIGGETILRATAFFPDPHIFAFYMGISLPFSFACSFFSENRREKMIFGIFTGLLFFADLLSFSRGGYVGVFFGALTAVFLLRKIIFSSFFGKIIAFSVVSAGLLLFFIPNPVQERAWSSFSLEDGSNSGRIAIWREAIVFSSEAPFFGYGLGNYPLAVKPTAEYREPIYAHDIFLDVELDLGGIGLILFSGTFFGSMYVFLKRKDLVSGVSVVALSIFLGHGLFENPLYSVHILPVLFLILSLTALREAE